MRRKMPPRWRTRTRWPREAVAAPARSAGFLSRTGRGGGRAGFNVEIKIAPLPPSARRQRGGRASALHAVQPSAPAGAGKVSMAPRRNGRGLWGYAPACCGRLHESVPSSTLAVQINHITKDGPRTRRPATPMELPRHASSTLPPPATRGVLALSLRVGLARQGTGRCSRHAGSRVGHFSIRDRAAPASLSCCESWRWRGCAGLHGRNLAAKQFPLRCAHSSQDKFFSLPGSPLRFDRKRCGQPIPAGRITTRTRWARPCSTRKEKHHG